MGFTPFYLTCRRKEDESKQSKHHNLSLEKIEAIYAAVQAVDLFLWSGRRKSCCLQKVLKSCNLTSNVYF